MGSKLSSIINSRSEAATDLLCKLISFRSLAGNEAEIQSFLADYVGALGFAPRLVPIHPGIESDEDYTTVPGHKGYDGRANLVLTVRGTGGGRSVVLNTHVDVVPGPDELFTPRVEDGVIHGRGACDAKGQIAVILLALQALREADVKLRGDLTVQFVIEEEAGGNGALSVIMDGFSADGVVVMEGTACRVYPANRGAVWFKLVTEGKSMHMGRWRQGVSAVDEMFGLINILKEYERKLVAESGGDPLFPDPAANIKVNVGTIQGGDWPSTVPAQCAVEGGIGFLPNKRLAEIREEVRREIETRAGAWAREHYDLSFERLHNEAYRTPPEHPLIQSLHAASQSVVGAYDMMGMTASCDARLFWHRGGFPTAVFGGGGIGFAHSDEEQIKVEGISTAARILADFLIDWCGA